MKISIPLSVTKMPKEDSFVKHRKLWICLSLTLMILALFAVSAAAVSPEELTLEMLAEANSYVNSMRGHLPSAAMPA